jgi:hypothetical protein
VTAVPKRNTTEKTNYTILYAVVGIPYSNIVVNVANTQKGSVAVFAARASYLGGVSQWIVVHF